MLQLKAFIVPSIFTALLAATAPSSHVRAAEEDNHQSLRGLSTLPDPKSFFFKQTEEALLANAAMGGDAMGGDAMGGEETCCAVQCTTPSNACCLSCSAVSSPREHDLLMAAMEGLTVHLMDKHQGEHDFLENRAWEDNSHIGNRPLQATFYYDWMRSIGEQNSARHVCEIGMNGGHSAVIFLAALAGMEGVHLTMFDLMMWAYSPTAAAYVEALYPGKMQVVAGNSRAAVPLHFGSQSADPGPELCDVFSVDGGHRYFEAFRDIVNAAEATKKGGIIILDDMKPGSKTRQAFDDAVEQGLIAEPRCVEGVPQKVGYVNRLDETNARDIVMAWCTATVI